MLRTRKWVPFRCHPSWIFLAVLLFLGSSLYFAFEETGFSQPLRAVVFGIDARMSEQQILEAKEVVQRATQKVPCSMGLFNKEGAWLCPLSEDRVFFLLELEGIVSSPAAQSLFPTSLQNVQDDTEYIIFSPMPNADVPSSRSMCFKPSTETGRWLLKKGTKEISIPSANIAHHIQENMMAHRQTWMGVETIVDREKYILLLLLIGVSLWRFRVLVPLLGCLCCMSSPLLLSQVPPMYEGNRLASSLSECNENAEAEQLLQEKFLTDVSEHNRSVYAFNLALLAARSGQYERAYFWLSQLDPTVSQNQSVQVLTGDVLSTLILTGKGDEEKRKKLESLAQKIPSTPWLRAALLYRSGGSSGVQGLEIVLQQATSPELFVLPQTWKDEMAQAFGVFQKQMNSSEFDDAFRKKDVGRLAILLDVAQQATVWDKIDRCICLGVREARLFELLGVSLDEGEKYSAWLFQQVKNLLKQVPKLDFSEIWNLPGSTQDKWTRLQYLSKVYQEDGRSVWSKALEYLFLIGKKEEKMNVLNFLLQRLHVGVSQNTSSVESVLIFFISTWSQEDPNDFLSILGRQESALKCASSISAYPQALLVFCKKGIDCVVQQQNLLSLVADAKNCVYVMGTFLSKFPNPSAAVDENKRLSQGVYMALQDKMKTDQEKRVVSELIEQNDGNETDENVFERTYDILRRLEFLLEQEDDGASNPPTEISQPGTVGVSKESAVQLLLELEHDEQNVLREVP